MDTSFYIEAQKRSRVTKLGAQTQHRVVLRLVPPSASKQSEIMCARDKCGVFHHIGKAISGSTGYEKGSPNVVTYGQQDHLGEKSTVILYTDINHHVGTDFSLNTKTKTKEHYQVFSIMASGKTKTKNYKNVEIPWPKKTSSKIVGGPLRDGEKKKKAGSIPGQPGLFLPPITPHKESLKKNQNCYERS